jgi:hypothetical protein
VSRLNPGGLSATAAMYYVLQIAQGSDLSAKHEVDQQLRKLREHTG